MKPGVDYIGVGVGAVIMNNDEKYFLSKRGKGARNENGKWEFPGGKLEYGETLEDGIKREIKEEYGNDIELETIRLITVTDHILKDENQHWVSPSFLFKLIKGEPKILEPEKCEEIGWFSLEEIAGMEITVPTKKDLEILIEQIKQNV